MAMFIIDILQSEKIYRSPILRFSSKALATLDVHQADIIVLILQKSKGYQTEKG